MTGHLYTNLKSLSVQMGQRAILIVGGLRKEEKLRVIRQRFGVSAEWHEIDADATGDADSIANRVRSGRIGAIVLLTGLMAHKVSDKIVKACAQANVPCVGAYTGGTAAIETAFNEIERRLAARA